MSEHIIETETSAGTAFVPIGGTDKLREEIVRCGDCKHATPDTSGRKCYEGYLWCDELTEGIGFSVAPSDFCAWGERRDA